MTASYREWLAVMLLLASLLSGDAFAQRLASVSGKASYVLGENDDITIREAKIKAVELAKAEALKNEFGVMVASDVLTSDQIVNDESNSFFLVESLTSVKGEWLGDTRRPVVSIESVDDDLVFTAEVWGEAREIVKAPADIKWHLFKESEGKRIETESFDYGERIFMNFLSPADGYAAVFLISSDEVSCLLPYRKDTKGRFRIKKGKEYIFFDKSVDPDASYYKLNTTLPKEYDQIVVVYSPNPFTTNMGETKKSRAPSIIDVEDFSKWLIRQQRADVEMVVDRKWISIKGEPRK